MWIKSMKCSSIVLFLGPVALSDLLLEHTDGSGNGVQRQQRPGRKSLYLFFLFLETKSPLPLHE